MALLISGLHRIQLLEFTFSPKQELVLNRYIPPRDGENARYRIRTITTYLGTCCGHPFL
jgi:hypothetical protein